MTTWVFPGQGSQAKGMGAALFDGHADLTAKADALLGYSVKELCLENPGGRLHQTLYTQPALYVVNALWYFQEVRERGQKPDFVAGHSLGEYNALLAAGGFTFETGLRLVKKRAELMAEARGGAMAAVLNCPGEKIISLLEEKALRKVDFANLNSPSQIVISGPAEEIQRAAKVFEEAGFPCIPLKVSGAFHSHCMDPAREAFARFLEGFTFSPLTIPVIANIHARPYGSGDIAANLCRQITHPVKWMESIQYLLDRGEREFREIGPGKVLTKLIADIRQRGFSQTAGPELARSAPQDAPLVKAPAQPPRESVPPAGRLTGEALGSAAFKEEYNLKYAYVAGAMTQGIASAQMVIELGKAGMMGFFGTGGLSHGEMEKAILDIREGLPDGQAYGMNLQPHIRNPQLEEETVDLFLKQAVRNVEAAAFLQVSPALVRYRLRGLAADGQGGVVVQNRIMAKVSRPEVAESFLSPAPAGIVRKLLAANKISQTQAELARKVAMADDLCVEGDSGGHTDRGMMTVLLPTMLRKRDEAMRNFNYIKKVRVGAAGGIGTPEAAAAAFLMGAEFILTGSINQCTVEAATSALAKNILQDIDVQDTAYAPSRDLFEMDGKIQVVRKGLFFPARANKLHELYRQYNSLEEIDEKTRHQIQERYLQRSFDDVYAEVRSHYLRNLPEEAARAERNPKFKMALIFKWYLGRSLRLALEGKAEHRVDFLIYCGPALGAFNQWVKGTELALWRKRLVAEIGKKLLDETAVLLSQRLQEFLF